MVGSRSATSQNHKRVQILPTPSNSDSHSTCKCIYCGTTHKGWCKERKREYHKQYNQKPEVKERKREYNQKPEVKERMREYNKHRKPAASVLVADFEKHFGRRLKRAELEKAKKIYVDSVEAVINGGVELKVKERLQEARK